ncbi:asparagine synthase C-terminal domain-containing protein [Salinirarus marinus]|uniref:asparagine synthase C-terminal domain-containing protein n=1 Tax=Salinirarus marinus TaxID=3068310 RepID=UPI003C6CAFF0
MRGTATETVRRALSDADPLPGTAGFAGELDGRLVRDVLGRHPLFSDADDPSRWSFEPTALESPRRVPAGTVRTAAGDERVWTLPEPAPRDAETALDAVRDAVETSVGDVAADDLAVAFSGGVDSAVVAAGVPDAPCYVVGFPGAHDVEAARAAAEAMNRDLRVVELDHADLERAVPELVRATGRTNAMDVQIALPLYLAAEAAAADGYDRLAVGQGADELFGGYDKVAAPGDDPRVGADTVRGAVRECVETLPAQLERDVLALRAAGVDPVAPLLHDRVVRAALPLPGRLLADVGERKIALRRAADGWLPDAVVDADKKAVQYGSLVARELDRLARRAGFKRRMDDHVGQYVRSLAE